MKCLGLNLCAVRASAVNAQNRKSKIENRKSKIKNQKSKMIPSSIFATA